MVSTIVGSNCRSGCLSATCFVLARPHLREGRTRTYISYFRDFRGDSGLEIFDSGVCRDFVVMIQYVPSLLSRKKI